MKLNFLNCIVQVKLWQTATGSGSGSVGLIIHVNTAEPNMTVSSSPNCNLQTGSAQQQGKRVREGGFFVCLQIRNNASLFSSKFYFWLSHKFECTCDRFWAKWEFCNFSIFLWFSDSVGLWWISRSHDMYRVQKWSQQQLKMHSNNCCTCITRYWVWLVHLLYNWNALQLPPPPLNLGKNYAELWGCTPSLRHRQIKWINWGKWWKSHAILLVTLFDSN